MNFLNPLILIGLVAASIPLILHLLNLRKLKTIDFSTLRFLKELQKTKIRRLKLKQILLLILRTLIIIFAVLAFSRPLIKSTIPGFAKYAKSSTVILIDNSFSMDLSDEWGNRFNQAKNAALSIIDDLKEGDEVTIIPMSNSENINNLRFTRNFTFLKEELKNIKISHSSANLEKSLRIASNLIYNSNNLNKEVYILTDAQRNIFENNIKDTLKLFPENTLLYFIPIGYNSKAEIQNLSIDSMNVLTRIFQKDQLVEVEARIKNNSNKEIHGAVISLFFNKDRVAQRSVDIQGNENKTISIAAAPQQYGVIKAFLELEDDALHYDNKRYFGFEIGQKPSVALIGSSENVNFLNLALNSKSDSYANVQKYSPSEFSSIDLTKFELVIIGGGPLKKNDFTRIQQYVQNGGSCLIFADEATDINIFKDGISLLGFGGIKQLTYSQNQPAMFTSVDKIHPLFEGVFKGTTDNKSIVESPKIFKAYSPIAGQPIIEFPGGVFLSESRINDGKIIYCAVPPTGSWSTFPFTGLFPALIHRSTLYLSSHQGISTNVIAGEPLRLSLPKKFATGKNFKIIDPENNEYFMQAVFLPEGAVLSFDNFKQFGNYVARTAQEKTAAIISVNPLPSESYIQPVSEKEIQQILEQRINPKAFIKIITDSQKIIQYINRIKTGTELWQLFVILALLCIIAEMIVARTSKNEIVDK